MSDLPDGKSPPVQVTLPVFTLAQPAHSGLTVYVSGAVEATNHIAASQAMETDLYAVETFSDTELSALSLSVSHPSSVWDDVLLPYSGSVTLATDSSGDVFGAQGNSGQTNPQVYQYLREKRGVSNTQSGTTPVP